MRPPGEEAHSLDFAPSTSLPVFHCPYFSARTSLPVLYWPHFTPWTSLPVAPDDLRLCFAEDFVFAAYLGEGGDGFVYVAKVVGGGELDADTG